MLPISTKKKQKKTRRYHSTKGDKGSMDGLTNFIELIIKRNVSGQIPWKPLEDAYSKSVATLSGGGGKKGGGSGLTPELQFWNTLNPKIRKSGLIVAIALTEEKNRAVLLTNLSVNLNDMYALLNAQDSFPFEASDILKEDALTELEFIKTNFSEEYNKKFSPWLKFEPNLETLEWVSSNRFQSLASMKFVTREYENCWLMGNKQPTTKMMTTTEEETVRNCIISKSTKPDEAFISFKYYIFLNSFRNKNTGFYESDKLETAAKEELNVRKEAETLNELNTHILLRENINNVKFEDFLICNDDFWVTHAKSELQHAINEYMTAAKLNLNPGLLLLIHDTFEVKDAKKSIKMMEIALKNYFYLSYGKIYDTFYDRLTKALEDFKPDLNETLTDERIGEEIDTFLRFNAVDAMNKNVLLNIKTSKNIESAKRFPYLASSKYIIHKNEPQSVILTPKLIPVPTPLSHSEQTDWDALPNSTTDYGYIYAIGQNSSVPFFNKYPAPKLLNLLLNKAKKFEIKKFEYSAPIAKVEIDILNKLQDLYTYKEFNDFAPFSEGSYCYKAISSFFDSQITPSLTYRSKNASDMAKIRDKAKSLVESNGNTFEAEQFDYNIQHYSIIKLFKEQEEEKIKTTAELELSIYDSENKTKLLETFNNHLLDASDEQLPLFIARSSSYWQITGSKTVATEVEKWNATHEIGILPAIYHHEDKSISTLKGLQSLRQTIANFLNTSLSFIKTNLINAYTVRKLEDVFTFEKFNKSEWPNALTQSMIDLEVSSANELYKSKEYEPLKQYGEPNKTFKNFFLVKARKKQYDTANFEALSLIQSLTNNFKLTWYAQLSTPSTPKMFKFLNLLNSTQNEPIENLLAKNEILQMIVESQRATAMKLCSVEESKRKIIEAAESNFFQKYPAADQTVSFQIVCSPQEEKKDEAPKKLNAIFKNEELTNNLLVRLTALENIFETLERKDKQDKLKNAKYDFEPYFNSFYNFMITKAMSKKTNWNTFGIHDAKGSLGDKTINDCNVNIGQGGSNTCQEAQDSRKYCEDNVFYKNRYNLPKKDSFIINKSHKRFQEYLNIIRTMSSTTSIVVQFSCINRMQEFELSDDTPEINLVLIRVKQDLNSIFTSTDPPFSKFPITPEKETQADAEDKLLNTDPSSAD